MDCNNSGDVGYCHLHDKTMGVIVSWDNNRTITKVDCDHESCGYSHTCKFYQKHPVGFHETYPIRE